MLEPTEIRDQMSEYILPSTTEKLGFLDPNVSWLHVPHTATYKRQSCEARNSQQRYKYPC